MLKLKSSVISIFVIYLVVQPVAPYIEYFTFRQHIINNFCIERQKPKSCCKGKCYLEKKIDEVNQTGNKDSKAPMMKKMEISPYIIPTIISYSNDFISMDYLYHHKNCEYHFLFNRTIFRPPEFAFTLS